MAVQEKDLQNALARAERAEAKVAELEARRQDPKDNARAQDESTRRLRVERKSCARIR